MLRNGAWLTCELLKTAKFLSNLFSRVSTEWLLWRHWPPARQQSENDPSTFRRFVQLFNSRSLLEKIVTRSLEGVGSIGPPPSTFDTIHPFDLKFGTYNKFHFYSQLSETTWCLIGFHGNNSQINDVTVGRHLGFSNFQILFKFSLFYLRLTGKQHLAVEIHEIVRIHCEVVSI